MGISGVSYNKKIQRDFRKLCGKAGARLHSDTVSDVPQEFLDQLNEKLKHSVQAERYLK